MSGLSCAGQGLKNAYSAQSPRTRIGCRYSDDSGMETTRAEGCCVGSIRIRIVVVRVCFIPAIASAFLCISQKMLFRIRCDYHTTSFAVIQMFMKLALRRSGAGHAQPAATAACCADLGADSRGSVKPCALKAKSTSPKVTPSIDSRICGHVISPHAYWRASASDTSELSRGCCACTQPRDNFFRPPPHAPALY